MIENNNHSCCLLNIAPAFRIQLGRWGEREVDKFMFERGWSLYKNNLKISGGEIDRIYKKAAVGGRKLVVIAEVKTRTFPSLRDVTPIFKTLLFELASQKKHQMNNLFRQASKIFSVNNNQSVFAVCFVVGVFPNPNQASIRDMEAISHKWGKIIKFHQIKKGIVIFSINALEALDYF